MANFVLVSQAVEECGYTGHHIRLLLREGKIRGKKQGGIWLVELEDLKRYEREMDTLGTKKFDPTRGEGEE